MHFLMLYEFVPDYLERRAAFRSAHLKLAWESQARGEMMLAGAFAEPADGAALLFNAPSARVVEHFARNDPYVKNGLVTRWQVRQWTTVIGDDAINPVRPD